MSRDGVYPGCDFFQPASALRKIDKSENSHVRCDGADKNSRRTSHENPNSAVIFIKEVYDKIDEHGVDDSNSGRTDQSMADTFEEIVGNTNRERAASSYAQHNIIGDFVHGSAVQLIVTIAVLVNTVMICLETSNMLKTDFPRVFQVLDAICIIIFTLEIIGKMVSSFSDFWFNGWNLFDLLIVMISLFATSLPFSSSFMVIRIFRIVRALRILKTVTTHNEMQVLFNAFILSIPDILSSVILIFLFVLICSFVGTSLFAQTSPTWFGTLPKSMYSMMILLTMDGWLDMYFDLREKGQLTMAQIYIYVTILFGANILINILNGVACNGLKASKKEVENDRKVTELEQEKEEKRMQEECQMRIPPLPGDLVWMSRGVNEHPPFIHVDQNEITKLRVVLEMMKKNRKNFQSLTKEFHKTFKRMSEVGEPESTSHQAALDLKLIELDGLKPLQRVQENSDE